MLTSEPIESSLTPEPIQVMSAVAPFSSLVSMIWTLWIWRIQPPVRMPL
jgi:hypothetical protein